MNKELLCRICNIKFDFKLAREFHFNLVHNCRAYMCKICEKSEDSQYKGSQYIHLELLDHNITFHEDNPYILLNLLIHIKMENVEHSYYVKHLLDISTCQCEKCEKQFKIKSSLVWH